MFVDEFKKVVEETEELTKLSPAKIEGYFSGLRSWLYAKGVSNISPAPWHTCPAGYDLVSQVLTRGPTLIDLWPETQTKFESRRGISVETFLGLVEAGAVIPDIYVRAEKAWNVSGSGYEYLKRLFDMRKDGRAKITMKGTIVDAFLERSGQSFRQKAEEECEKWRGLVDINPDQAEKVVGVVEAETPTQVSNKSDRLENAIKSAGYTHAYINLMCPEVIDGVKAKIESGGIADALEDLYHFKRFKVSPITAALGGTLYWSAPGIDVIRRKPDLMRHIHAVSSDDSMSDLRGLETSNYAKELAAKFLRSRIPGLSDVSRHKRLVEIISQTGLQTINARLQDFESALMACSVSPYGVMLDHSEWEKLLEERRKILTSFENVAERLTRTAFITGLFLKPNLEKDALAVIAGAVMNEVGKPDRGLGRLAHGIFLQDHHRLITAADNIEALAIGRSRG